MESEIQLFLFSRRLLKSSLFRKMTNILFFSSALLSTSLPNSFKPSSQGIFFISALICSNLLLKSSQPCFLNSYKSLVFDRGGFFIFSA